ncbi:MAG: hypothetical protein ACTHOH_11850 [Lysobacteraceae bacterium]
MKATHLFAACLALALPALVIGPDAFAAGSSARSERGELVRRIVLKWGGHVQEAYKSDVGRWAGNMGAVFAKSPIESLRRAADAKTFEQMNDELLGVAGKPGASPSPLAASSAANGDKVAKALGDAAGDLVYVPVTPCRILDTRVPGTPIAANGTLNVDVTSVTNYSFQGGDSSNCGGVGAAGSFAAAAINFTVVTPSAAGYITAYPYGTTKPLAATVNYTAGDIRGNFAVVQLDQTTATNEMTIYSYAQTHVVADIVGYYINPAPTALQCVDTANTIVSVAAGATSNAYAPACAAGYTATATNCEAGSWQMPIVFNHAGACSALNNGASAAELRASRTCCRVPGR